MAPHSHQSEGNGPQCNFLVRPQPISSPFSAAATIFLIIIAHKCYAWFGTHIIPSSLLINSTSSVREKNVSMRPDSLRCIIKVITTRVTCLILLGKSPQFLYSYGKLFCVFLDVINFRVIVFRGVKIISDR